MQTLPKSSTYAYPLLTGCRWSQCQRSALWAHCILMRQVNCSLVTLANGFFLALTSCAIYIIIILPWPHAAAQNASSVASSTQLLIFTNWQYNRTPLQLQSERVPQCNKKGVHLLWLLVVDVFTSSPKDAQHINYTYRGLQVRILEIFSARQLCSATENCHMQTAGKKQHICVTPPFKLSVKPMEYARRSNGTSIRGSLLDYGRAVYINRKRYHVVVCVSSVGYEATGSGNRVVLCQMDMTFQTHIHYNMCACRMWIFNLVQVFWK